MAVVGGGSLACTAPDMSASPSPAAVERRPRPVPATPSSAGDTNLLAFAAEQRSKARPEGYASLALPQDAERLVFTVLDRVAHDELEHLLSLTTSQARWGLPHRAELIATPVREHPEHFMDALRSAGSRMPAGAELRCATSKTGALPKLMSSGAEPVWCRFREPGGTPLDWIVFQLRMEAGRAKVAYVGLFERAPTGPVRAVGVGDGPPERPPRDPSPAPKRRTYRRLGDDVPG